MCRTSSTGELTPATRTQVGHSRPGRGHVDPQIAFSAAVGQINELNSETSDTDISMAESRETEVRSQIGQLVRSMTSQSSRSRSYSQFDEGT